MDTITVYMASDEFGRETYSGLTLAEALATVRRLAKAADAEADGVRREIGIIVNPGILTPATD